MLCAIRLKPVVLALLLLILPQARAGSACELELVLAVDVSGSVNRDEYRLQMGGLAAALRSEEVARLLAGIGHKGVYLTLLQWSGEPHQVQSVPWRRIETKQDVGAFAAEIERAPRAFRIYSTAIGQALVTARALFSANNVDCRRRVVDISGDGRSNEGLAAPRARDLLLAEGIAINGLVIQGDDKGLKRYFRQNVIGGNGAFVMAVATFEEYPDAIRRKLLREISPKIIDRRGPSRRRRKMAGRGPVNALFAPVSPVN